MLSLFIAGAGVGYLPVDIAVGIASLGMGHSSPRYQTGTSTGGSGSGQQQQQEGFGVSSSSGGGGGSGAPTPGDGSAAGASSSSAAATANASVVRGMDLGLWGWTSLLHYKRQPPPPTAGQPASAPATQAASSSAAGGGGGGDVPVSAGGDDVTTSATGPSTGPSAELLSRLMHKTPERLSSAARMRRYLHMSNSSSNAKDSARRGDGSGSSRREKMPRGAGAGGGSGYRSADQGGGYLSGGYGSATDAYASDSDHSYLNTSSGAAPGNNKQYYNQSTGMYSSSSTGDRNGATDASMDVGSVDVTQERRDLHLAASANVLGHLKHAGGDRTDRSGTGGTGIRAGRDGRPSVVSPTSGSPSRHQQAAFQSAISQRSIARSYTSGQDDSASSAGLPTDRSGSVTHQDIDDVDTRRPDRITFPDSAASADSARSGSVGYGGYAGSGLSTAGGSIAGPLSSSGVGAAGSSAFGRGRASSTGQNSTYGSVVPVRSWMSTADVGVGSGPVSPLRNLAAGLYPFSSSSAAAAVAAGGGGGAGDGAGLSGEVDTVLSPEALAAALESAEAKRARILEARVTASKIHDAEVTSRLALHEQAQRREAARSRVAHETSLTAAHDRRREAVDSKLGTIRSHTARVEGVKNKVAAARRVQGWYRFRRIVRMGDKEADSKIAASSAASSAAGASSTAAAASSSAGHKQQGPAAFAPPPSAARHAPTGVAEEVSLGQRERASRRAVTIMTAPQAQKALLALFNAICGTPALDDGSVMGRPQPQPAAAAGGGFAASDSGAQGTAPASPLVGAPSSPVPVPFCPFASFDDCALAIQQRGVLAAAQAITVAVMKAYSILEEQHAILAQTAMVVQPSLSGAVTSPGRSTSAAPSSSSPAAEEAGSASASLRPTVAKSPRTLLAALLIAYFPQEILSQDTGTAMTDHGAASTTGQGGPGEGATSRASRAKQERDQALVLAARRMLAALHALSATLISDAGVMQAAGVPVARAGGYGLDGHRPDMNLDTSVYVDGDLRNALTTTTTTAATAAAPSSTAPSSSASPDPEFVAQALHAILTFNQAWVVYMDSFMVWKQGDGMRVAQSLAHPYRQLQLRRVELTREADTRIGQGDAGLEQLREGVDGQISQIRSQLVSLLGQKGAERWEKDQIAGMEAERAREMQQQQQQRSRAGSTASMPSPSLSSAPSPPGRVPIYPVSGPSGSSRRGSGSAGVPPASSPAPLPPISAPSPWGSTGPSPAGEGLAPTGSLSPYPGSGRTPAGPGITGMPATATAASPASAAAAAAVGAGMGVGGGGGSGPRAAHASPQMSLFRQVMSNDVLAHELMVDPTFRLVHCSSDGACTMSCSYACMFVASPPCVSI